MRLTIVSLTDRHPRIGASGIEVAEGYEVLATSCKTAMGWWAAKAA